MQPWGARSYWFASAIYAEEERQMLRLSRLLLVLVLGLGLGACGGDKSCKNACDKLSSCGLKSSGFSCDATCASPEDACAVCVNAQVCSDIAAGKCASDCPKATFTNK